MSDIGCAPPDLVRWYPHCAIHSANLLVYSEDMIRQIDSQLTRIRSDSDVKKAPNSNHFVLLGIIILPKIDVCTLISQVECSLKFTVKSCRHLICTLSKHLALKGSNNKRPTIVR